MKLDNFVASSDIYDVYESDGMAVRIYKKPEYKEKCLYCGSYTRKSWKQHLAIPL